MWITDMRDPLADSVKPAQVATARGAQYMGFLIRTAMRDTRQRAA